MIPLEPEAVYVLRRLLENGYEAYVVGGYVRDRWRGRPTNDIDIATSALPEQTMALFERTVPTGLQHGTVMVLYNDKAYEVTTFRTESDYEQYRRPKEVAFVQKLEEDLKRRDFTINAMAMDVEGTLIDPFGGWNDLEQGIIRCVGQARERFSEDALRMVRCIRFAANFASRIENSTWEALLANKKLLKHIAMERIYAEWEKIMAGPDPYRGLVLLIKSGLLEHLKRELPWPLVHWRSEADLPPELARINSVEQANLRWTLLIRSMNLASDTARQGMAQLTFPRNKAEKLVKLMEMDKHLLSRLALENTDVPAELVWKETVLRYGVEAASGWLALAGVLSSASDGREEEDFPAVPWSAVRAEDGQRWLEEMPVKGLGELAVSGSDLMEWMERSGGPWISRLLERLLREAALGECPNIKEELLRRAQYYLANE
ncbi:CCA tRNA nucleotidyltransferase [Paenibacillus sp. J2TS4]|uniref:CCA tRNA nucleotidyltransferase n=1 Tax=Paenibacillus sp. J2TS4 TaxID=2807194 RepID=UPI001B1BE233|nr:CCA tRNA nucleotidyltransferase [Paenibacillus sp. J2TS4]GIP32423.1 CCA-adding enzyme [Paenibacillus sp. J2TS4]